MITRKAFLNWKPYALLPAFAGALYLSSMLIPPQDTRPAEPKFSHDPKAGEDIGLPKGNIIPESEKHDKTIEGILIKNTSDEVAEVTIKKVVIKDNEEPKKFIYDFRNLSCKSPCVSMIEEGQIEANDEDDFYKILAQEVNFSNKKEVCDLKSKCKVQSLSSRKK